MIRLPAPTAVRVYPPPPPTIMWLKTPAAPERAGGTLPESAAQEEEHEDPMVLCRECLFPVTREEAQTTISGGFQHTFANPAGIVFTIGCFREPR